MYMLPVQSNILCTSYVPILKPQLKRLMSVLLNISKGPAQDVAEILHCLGSRSGNIEAFFLRRY
jgi:hypothetical protein